MTFVPDPFSQYIWNDNAAPALDATDLEADEANLAAYTQAQVKSLDAHVTGIYGTTVAPAIGFGRIKYDNVGGTYPLSTADCQQRGYGLLILQTLMSAGGGDTANAAAELATNNAIRANNAQPCKILMYRGAFERWSDTYGNTTFTKPGTNTSQMYLYDSTGAKYTGESAVLTAPLSTGSPITSITGNVNVAMGSGVNYTLTDLAGHTQTVTTSGAVSIGTGVSIPVNSFTPNFAYPATSSYLCSGLAGGNPQMDIGNVAYQNLAIARLIAMCQAGGYDGPFFDNWFASPIANGVYTTLLPAAGTLASDANYNAALNSFITNCKQQCKAAGLTCVMANAGGTVEIADMVPVHVSRFTAGLDGLLNESFLTQLSSTSTVFNPNTTASPLNGDGTPVVENTFQILEQIKPPQFMAVHSYIQGFANGGVHQSNFYTTISSALLAANGHCIVIVDDGKDATGVAPLSYANYTTGRPAGPWHVYYDRARELGKPLAPRIKSNGIWMRYFQNGVVLVNNTNGTLVEPNTGLTITAHQSDIFLYRKVRAVLPYSASITPLAPSLGRYQRVVPNNGTAFTINAPVDVPQVLDYQEFTLEIHNVSGGALGAITWDPATSLYVFPTAWVSPATGKSRFVKFEWNGTNWIAVNVAAADF